MGDGLSIILARGKKASPDAVAKMRASGPEDGDESDPGDEDANFAELGKLFYKAMKMCMSIKKGGYDDAA